MYVIVTSNLKLLECIKRNNGDILVTPKGINLHHYSAEIAGITSNKKLAVLAMIDGAKVYETQGMYGVSAIGAGEKGDIVDMLIEGLLESLNVSRKYRGYEYIKYMIKSNVKDDTYCLKKPDIEIYTDCAKKFGASNNAIALMVARSIKEGYEKDPFKFETMFHDTYLDNIEEAIKAKNFISVMANKIRKLIPND